MKTEADKLRNSIQYGLGVIDSGSGEFKELSDKIDELFELSYLEGQSSPKIKQLEWVEVSSYYLATNEFGFYKIMHNLGSWYLYFNARFILDYANPDEAKVVAQADFEKKVRECLE